MVCRFVVMDRQARRQELLRALKVESTAEGYRLVTLQGAVLGRLGQDPETGHWQLERREGWERNPSDLRSERAEDAEAWAIEEVADLLAMERHAIDSGKPWGKSPPPGAG
jgi:hypothetical protein